MCGHQIIVAQLRIIADAIGLASGKQWSSVQGAEGEEGEGGQKGGGARHGGGAEGEGEAGGWKGKGARQEGKGVVSSGARVVQERGLDLRPKLLLRVSLVLGLPSFHAFA